MKDNTMNKENNMTLPPITSAFLVLTQACNLKCKYCFVVQKPSFKIGDIDSGASEERRWDIIAQFNPKTVVSSDQSLCADCPMYMICDGACTINNYFVNGSLNVMPDILCFYYRCLYEEAKRIQAEAKKEAINPTILRKRGIFKC